MAEINKLLKFLDELEKRNIYYKLNHVRNSVMVEIAIPGERWEVEFMDDGFVEVEKFISTGCIYGEEELIKLFKTL